jgi:3-deoxy-D-manno-octulosonic acid kinase
MRPINEQYAPTVRGGILYDASVLRKPGDELFTREYWAARGALQEVAGGRGTVSLLQAGDQSWVLRHYRRGGWMAKLSDDRYAWAGQDRTRSFAEWRLLAELRRRGLPVPAPVAARFVRSGCTYRADLITERLPPSHTLADRITAAALPAAGWVEVGRTLATFHRQGVHHADLNANNILLCEERPASGAERWAVYLLDFDRGRLRARGSWESEVLARLRRSLDKIHRLGPQVVFAEADWRALMEGYQQALAG